MARGRRGVCSISILHSFRSVRGLKNIFFKSIVERGKRVVLYSTSISIAIMADPFVGLVSGPEVPKKAKVNFDFTAQAANQINLKAGQLLELKTYGGPGNWSSAAEIGTGIVEEVD